MASNLAGDGEIRFKVGLVGESGVGKSCLLVRWVDDDFFEAEDRFTIGVDFKNKVVTVKDKQVKLQIHDTAGQERFRTVTASFYRGAHGIFLVYDMTDSESFAGKVEEWLREIRNYTPEKTPVILVGNKSDKAAKRVIDYETAKAWADKEGLYYIETSAKDGSNVNQAFMTLAEKIMDNKFGQEERNIDMKKSNSTDKRRFCTII